MNRPAHVEKVMAALAPLRNRYTSEAALQSAIGGLLENAGFTVIPERRLSQKERIDFDVTVLSGLPSVGIEVKCQGGEMGHLRQLYRYAPHYTDLILVTTQASRPEDQELIVTPPAATKTRRRTSTAPHVCRLHVINISLRL